MQARVDFQMDLANIEEQLREWDEFQKIVEDRDHFIDRTHFIKTVVEGPFKMIAILCPQGSGKSPNLAMLKSFPISRH